jgi:hypothetical protein
MLSVSFLICRECPCEATFGDEKKFSGARAPARKVIMNDFIYIAVILSFFALSHLYVRFCDKL